MPAVKLKTFLQWPTDGEIGYRTDGDFVEFVWWKTCAKHIQKIESDSRLKGRAKAEIHKFAEGTNYVTKHTVCRHLNNSLAHEVGLSYERLENETVNIRPRTDGGTGEEGMGEPLCKQPKIDSAMRKSVEDGYRRLFRTAFMMAFDGLPLCNFATLVKVQRANGVRLIQGAEGGKWLIIMITLTQYVK